VGTWRVPSLTAADAIAAFAPGVGGASPPLPSGAFRSRLSHQDARAPRPHRARLLPRRLPPLPPPARHAKLPPRRRGIMVCRRLPRRLPFLPKAHRRRNTYLLFTSLNVSPLLMKEPSGFHKPNHKLVSVVAVGDLER
jgi:hypothetical protein